MDCREGLASLSDGLIQLCLTDPPFGIDLDLQKKGSKREEIYDDDLEKTYHLMQEFIPLLFKKMAANSHLYMWFPMRHYTEWFELLETNGFETWPVPLVWVRRKGQCSHPHKWPASVVDTCFFARKGEMALAKQGRLNVIAPSVSSSDEGWHPLQKPLEVSIDLLERSAFPGMMVCDPFCGSGETFIAALSLEMGLKFLGFEKEERFRNRAVAEVVRFVEERKSANA